MLQLLADVDDQNACYQLFIFRTVSNKDNKAKKHNKKEKVLKKASDKL